MKRKIIRTLKWLLLFLIFLLFWIWFLFTTPLGLQFSQRLLPKIVPGLTFETITGRLGSHFIVNNVRFSNDYVDIVAKTLELTWIPKDIFRRKLVLSQIVAQGLDIHIRTNENPKNRRNFKWANNFLLQNIDLNNVRVFYQNELKAYFNRIKTQNNEDGTFNIQVLLPQGSAEGQYALQLGKNMAWQMHLTATQVDSNYLWKSTHALLNFDFDWQGNWGRDNKTTTFILSNLTGKIRGYPLNGDIHIRYLNGRTFIDAFHLKAADTLLNVHGEIGQVWNVAWNIRLPNLNFIDQNASGYFESNGKIITNKNHPVVNGNIIGNNIHTALFSIGNLHGNFTSTTRWQDPASISLWINYFRYKNHVIPEVNAKILAKRIANHLIMDVNMNSDVIDSANGRLAITNFFVFHQKQMIHGKIFFTLHNFEHYFNIPYAKNVTGTLLGELNLNGALRNPAWSLRLHAENGQLLIPKLGITLHQIQFQTFIHDDQPTILTGEFTSGGGHATFQSRINFFGNNSPLQIHIIGDNLQLVNLKEYKIIGTPNVVMTYENNITSFSGTVFIPRARITTETYQNIVSLPSEVIFVGVKSAPINYFKNVSLRLRVSLGDDIFVSYKKLKAFVTGSLFVYQNPGGLASGNGILRITHGTYEVYNRLFSIDDGKLIFVGNLITNPGLSIRAIKQWSPTTRCFFGFEFPAPNQISQLNVGVFVSGTLDSPQLSLISDPPMAQDDILSYIVFDQRRSQIGSSGDALSLLGTLTSSLNLQGPSAVDEPPNNGAGALFGIFKMGLFNPTQAFNFTLPISNHWVIQTEASLNETGVDLFYNYERD